MNGLELVRQVAAGSAVDAVLGRLQRHHVVVQVARPALTEHADLTRRAVSLTREGALHPELIGPGRASQMNDGRLAFVSEPLTGWTAADFLRLSGPVAPLRVVEWGVSVCEALSALHVRDRVHGCLAPRHLHLIGDSDRPGVRLFDTSLLHLRGKTSLPVAGCVVEPEYLSPERASGSRCTVASDVWGVGVLLVELLRGRPPFRAATPERTRALLAQAPELPTSLFGAWSPVLKGCLDPVPGNRFASVLEVRQALSALA